jgi:predicted Zn-dependent protease
VNTGLLNQNRPDTELRGVFAHELGHLILRTFLSEVQRQVRGIYRIGESEDGIIGEVQDDDPALANPHRRPRGVKPRSST